MGKQKTQVVPGTLQVSPKRQTTSTFVEGDLGSTLVLRSSAAFIDMEGGH